MRWIEGLRTGGGQARGKHAAIVLLASALASCTEFYLPPEAPQVSAKPHDPAATSKLFVILDPGEYASKYERWAVYVDDELRAWLPADRERISTGPVKPGAHRVSVEWHVRYMPYLIVPLPPMKDVKKASVETVCADGANCGAVALLYRHNDSVQMQIFVPSDSRLQEVSTDPPP